jgi:hypothetical protein
VLLVNLFEKLVFGSCIREFRGRDYERNSQDAHSEDADDCHNIVFRVHFFREEYPSRISLALCFPVFRLLRTVYRVRVNC